MIKLRVIQKLSRFINETTINSLLRSRYITKHNIHTNCCHTHKLILRRRTTCVRIISERVSQQRYDMDDIFARKRSATEKNIAVDGLASGRCKNTILTKPTRSRVLALCICAHCCVVRIAEQFSPVDGCTQNTHTTSTLGRFGAQYYPSSVREAAAGPSRADPFFVLPPPVESVFIGGANRRRVLRQGGARGVSGGGGGVVVDGVG